MTRTTCEAVRLLESELGAGRRGVGAEAEEAWGAFLRFGRLSFDVPDVPDADGLLFQYGTHAFDGPPVFMLDFVRQFEAVDGDGGHDHYVQVHCELRYGPTPALEVLGAFGSWFFRGAGEELDAWAGRLAGREVWAAVRSAGPAVVRVYQERM